MKRWHFFALAAALAGGWYFYTHWTSLDFSRIWPGPSSAGAVHWRTLDRPDDGFKIQFPADEKDIQVPAYTDSGAVEPVKMLVANPDENTTFALAWQDNPPVARVSPTPARILDMARDGMLARTQTTLVKQSPGSVRGNPSLDVSARNAGGGILDARLICTGNRLYTLMAVFPSAGARREGDVRHFFGSFALTPSTAIPSSVPEASPN